MGDSRKLRRRIFASLLVLGWSLHTASARAQSSTDDDDSDFFGMFLTTVGATSVGSFQLTKRVVLGKPQYAPEDQKAGEFIDSNYEAIRHDLAVGEGEHARSLAVLLSVETKDVPLFLHYGKENYGALYPPEKDVPAVLSEMKNLALMSIPSTQAFSKPGFLMTESKFPPRALPTWKPEKGEIQELEARLFSYLENLPQMTSRILAPNLRKYGRQYFPFRNPDGSQIILVNAFCTSLGQTEEKLRSQIFAVDDGGQCFFQIEFDPIAHTFSNYRPNGEA